MGDRLRRGRGPPLPIYLLSVLPLFGCGLGWSGSGESPGPVEWPEGVFALSAMVQFNRPADLRPNSREMYEAELTIGPGRQMTLQTPAGVCWRRDEEDVERELARGARTFTCGTAQWVIQPAGTLVRGRVSVPYERLVQGQRHCVARDENGGCIEYDYSQDIQQSWARATLRVVRREGGSGEGL